MTGGYRPSRGGKVHELAMAGDSVAYTRCRLRADGWIAVPEQVDCQRCLQLQAR